MNIDDDAKEHATKKMKTMATSTTELDSFDFDLAEPTAQFSFEDTMNKQQQDIKIETTSDIMVKSDQEPYVKTPQRKTTYEWKDQ
ncbi:38636_t:CDS:2, partial [Gigaspora margarita]